MSWLKSLFLFKFLPVRATVFDKHLNTLEEDLEATYRTMVLKGPCFFLFSWSYVRKKQLVQPAGWLKPVNQFHLILSVLVNEAIDETVSSL